MNNFSAQNGQIHKNSKIKIKNEKKPKNHCRAGKRVLKKIIKTRKHLFYRENHHKIAKNSQFMKKNRKK